jgi:phosphotransferase family enzyme
MTVTLAPPTDADVVRCLAEGLRRRGERAGVAAVDRAPYPYATSFPLEEVVARLDDGRTLHLILKDLTWDALLGDARRTKPPFLYDPRRCMRTYDSILPGTGVGVACWGTLSDERSGRHLLLLERVPGVELWQVGDLGVWASVARWLARFHQAFAAEGEAVGRRNPHLLRYGPELLRTWPGRALAVATARGAGEDQRRRLRQVARSYDFVVDRLTAGPQQLVHGELYPSNVLVGRTGAGTEVWPVDWEMAGVGSPQLDVAALTGGWQGWAQQALVDAYLDELGPAARWGDRRDVATLLDCGRLHYALQWLGWSPEWCPPAEHARDWVAEGLAVAERLGLA